ncbi:MAG: flagellar protein FlaG [Clostridiaceae bacterium]|nr:flagellar protein FlaG [Clostridiaceae bacterium]
MAMDSYMNAVSSDYEKVSTQEASAKVSAAVSSAAAKIEAELRTGDTGAETENGEQDSQYGIEKQPSKSSIDAAIASVNAQMSRTRCAYAYDEDTKRITVKIYDEETDELIREVPPERSLEVLKKLWEIAGIVIDQKL